MEQEKLQTRLNLIRYVSHEMRTPLNTAILGLKFVEDEFTKITDALDRDNNNNNSNNDYKSDNINTSCNPEVKEKRKIDKVLTTNMAAELLDTIKVITDAADVTCNTLNDLLTFDKIDEQKIEIEVDTLKPLIFFSEALKSFQLNAKQSNIQLTFVCEECEDDPLWESKYIIQADKFKLNQVIRNLLSNAIKFTPRNGQIKLVLSKIENYSQSNIPKTEETQNLLRIQVIDTGYGISKENQKRLFGQYVQFNASAMQKGGGSGLGLWISKSIVEMHGGFIKATSEGENKGTTFQIELPLIMIEETRSSTRSVVSSTNRKNNASVHSANKKTSYRISDRIALLVGKPNLSQQKSVRSSNSHHTNSESNVHDSILNHKNNHNSNHNNDDHLSDLEAGHGHELVQQNHNEETFNTNDSLSKDNDDTQHSIDRNISNNSLFSLHFHHPVKKTTFLDNKVKILVAAPTSKSISAVSDNLLTSRRHTASAIPDLSMGLDNYATTKSNTVPSHPKLLKSNTVLQQLDIESFDSLDEFSNKNKNQTKHINITTHEHEKHGHKIVPYLSIDSEENTNTKPDLPLLIDQDDTNTLNQFNHEQKDNGHNLSWLSELKFLVVDDSSMNRKMTKRFLVSHGHNVTEAEDGADCLAKFFNQTHEQLLSILNDNNSSNNNKTHTNPTNNHTLHHDNNNLLHLESIFSECQLVNKSFDVILMDENMPNMSGPEACHLLRKKGFTGLIYGVTGDSDEKNIHHYEECGANKILIKPLNIDLLRRAIEAI
eukprot:gene6711-9204_t